MKFLNNASFENNSLLKVRKIILEDLGEVSLSKGEMAWNPIDRTVSVGINEDQSLELGQEMVTNVLNNTGVTILNGTVVGYAGTVGETGILKGKPYIANGIEPPEYIIGIATRDIPNGEQGHVTNFGKVKGLDTTGGAENWTSGQVLFASSTEAGKLTNIEPVAPSIKMPIAVILLSHATTGVIETRVNIKHNLSQLNDISVVTPENGDLISWNDSLLRWENKNVGELGIATPQDLVNKLDSSTFEKIDRFGFLNQIDTTISFDSVNTFTLSPVDTTWSYFFSGKLVTITGPKSINISDTPPATTGPYFITIASMTGDLVKSMSPWSLENDIVPVAIIYWDNTQTPKFLLQDERHSCLIDRRAHSYLHTTQGTKFLNGCALSGYTLNSSVDTNKVFGISETKIADEDIFHTLGAVIKPNGISAVYLNVYRNSLTTWAWSYLPFPFKYTTTGFIEYDLNGVMTPTSNNRFVNTYLMATNTVAPGNYVFIPGRSDFSSLDLALLEDFRTFDMTGFITPEAVAIYQLTWKGVNNAGTGQCQLTNIEKISGNIVTSSASVVSVEHNASAGLQGGSIGEYYHLTQTQHVDLTDSGDSTLHYHSSDRNRANHTGTQSADTLTEGVTNKLYTSLEKAKLAAIEEGATADMTPSELLAAIKTVDGVASGLDSDTLDGQHGSYYIDWANMLNKPDPTITLSGDLSGSVTLTDLGNGTLTATVIDDSHNHITSNVDGLDTTLGLKAPLASPALTGVPTSTTAAVGTNTTQIATTAFVNAEIANDATPISHVGSTGESHGLSTSLVNGFMSSADKIKIDGIEASANNYIHPASHSPSIITQDSNNRFVTDAEKTTWNAKASTGVATTSTNGLMSSTDKTKIDGIASGAEVNQNAFSNIVVSGQTTVAADTKTDTLTLVAGSNVAIITNATTDTITISSTDTNTTYTGSNGITLVGNDFQHVDTSSQGSLAALTGANVVSDIDIDGYGHVTSLATRALTAADIGASATSHNHTLDSLSNTTITSNTSGEILKWNGTAWINNTLAEAGIQPAGSYLTENQTITLSGDATGSGTTSIAVTVADNSHNHTWSNISDQPDPVITLAGDATGSVTLTNLASGTLTVAIVDDSHNHIISNVDGLQAALDGKLSAEVDTLATVTSRGATTASAVTLSSTNNHYNGHHLFDAYDAAGNHYPHYASGSNNTGAIVNWRIYDGASTFKVLQINGATSAFTWNNNKIWHAGNDGDTSGLDADLLDGYNSSIANTPSTVVVRDTDGSVSATDMYKFGAAASIKYNSTTKSIDFIFN